MFSRKIDEASINIKKSVNKKRNKNISDSKINVLT